MTRTAGDALLADILADPADDTPRLVLADWMEDQAAPALAELAGVRHELEGLEDGDWREEVIAGRWGKDDQAIARRGAEILRLRRREAELAPVAALADRAEFIRVQIRLASDPWVNRRCVTCGDRVTMNYGSFTAACKRCSARAALRRRERELWRLCSCDFAAELNCVLRLPRTILDLIIDWYPGDGSAISVVYRRGFVAEARAPLDALRAHLPALARAHPVEDVRATDRRPHTWWVDHWVWYGNPVGSHVPTASRDRIAATLPREVFDALSGGSEDPEGRGRIYGSEADAFAALSSALLALARRAIPRRECPQCRGRGVMLMPPADTSFTFLDASRTDVNSFDIPVERPCPRCGGRRYVTD